MNDIFEEYNPYKDLLNSAPSNFPSFTYNQCVADVIWERKLDELTESGVEYIIIHIPADAILSYEYCYTKYNGQYQSYICRDRSLLYERIEDL